MNTIEAICAACGTQYSDRPSRIGAIGFCSHACRTSRRATELRFFAKVKYEENGCWMWTGGISKHGYGKFGKCGSSHRYAYLTFVGKIPAGLHLDHLCRNRACCNPDHLEPVTCRENMLRGENFTAKNAAKTHCPKGHKYTPSNTKITHLGGRACRACQREYDNTPDRRRKRMLYKRQVRAAADAAGLPRPC